MSSNRTTITLAIAVIALTAFFPLIDFNRSGSAPGTILLDHSFLPGLPSD